MKKFTRILMLLLAIIAAQLSVTPTQNATAQESKQKCKVAPSVYAGWMPWVWLAESGVMQKWADAYNCEVEILPLMAYDASISAYSAGEVDAVPITNMDAIQGPCRSGRKTVALINGDFSNGNDAVIGKGVDKMTDLKGMKVMLLEGSVSQYLFVQGLVMNKMKESDVAISNVSDSVIAATYLADNSAKKAVTTWTPFTLQALEQPGSKVLFDSSQIPGHIQDWLMVSQDCFDKKPNCVKALVGAWYEAMRTLSTRGEARTKMVAAMAKASECTPASFEQQLKTTALYTSAEAAAAYTKGEEMKERTMSVKDFCVAHPPTDVPAKTIENVGIKFPDGSIIGPKDRVMLTFDASITELAAKGELKRE